jgi:SAM-dependent methyltransferase
MDFGDVEYWERFYQRFLPSAASENGATPGTEVTAPHGMLAQYEWYFEAATLLPLLLRCMPEVDSAPSILMLGCGSSHLSELLYEAGYHHISNVDFSPLVISSMQEKTRFTCPQLQWLVMDVTNMRSLCSSRCQLYPRQTSCC